MSKKKSRYYLIANRTRARIYKDTESHPFELVEELTNPKGRLRDRARYADGPGSNFSSATGSIHHSVGSENTQHEHALEIFTKEIAHRIDLVANSGEMHDLVLAAEPHFMGVLRKSLGKATEGLVAYELLKDYCPESQKDEADVNLRKKIISALEKES